MRGGRRPLATRPWRPPLSPSDVERRQFIREWLTLRLRSALMALSVAESSGTTAPMLATIVEHHSHILRSINEPRSSKKGCSSPAPEAKCGPRVSGRRAMRQDVEWHICHRLEQSLLWAFTQTRSLHPAERRATKNAVKTKLSAI